MGPQLPGGINIGVAVTTVADPAGLVETQTGIDATAESLKALGTTADAASAQVTSGLDKMDAGFLSLGATTEEYQANMALIAAATDGAEGSVTILGETIQGANGQIVASNQDVVVSEDALVENMQLNNSTILALYQARIAAAEESAAGQDVASVGGATAGDVAGAALKGAGSAGATGVGGLAGLVSNPYVIGAAAIAGATVLVTKSAGDFQASVQRLYSTAGETAPLQQLDAGIQQVAEDTGVSSTNLTTALYHISSAGYSQLSGINVLKSAAQAAQEEGANAADVANALVTVMHDYGASASDAQSYTNQMLTAVSEGNVTLQDFSTSLATVLPVANQVGLSFSQVGGSIATLTESGISAQQSTQDLAAVIKELSGATITPKEINNLQNYGLSVTQLEQDLGKKGLTGTLEEVVSAITKDLGPSGLVVQQTFQNAQVATADLQTELGNMPPQLKSIAQELVNGTISYTDYRKATQALPEAMSNLAKQFEATYNKANSFNTLLSSSSPDAQTYIAALKGVFGQSDTLQGVLALTGSNAITAQTNIDKVAASGKSAGNDIQGWSNTQHTFNNELATTWQTIQTIGQTIGTTLLPVIGGAVSGMDSGLLKPISNWLNSGQDLITYMMGGNKNTVENFKQPIMGEDPQLAQLSKDQQQVKKDTDAVTTATNNLKIAQDAANGDAAKTAAAQQNVAKAQQQVNDALAKYGQSSPQYQQASDNLTTAEDNLNVQLLAAWGNSVNVKNATNDLANARYNLLDATSNLNAVQLGLNDSFNAGITVIKQWGPTALNQVPSIDTLQNHLGTVVTTFNGLNSNVTTLQAGLPKVNTLLQGLGSTIDTIQPQQKNSVNHLQGATVSLQLTGGSLQGGGLASGTSYAPGGRTLVGEDGPEYVDLPIGSRVYPTAQTSRMTNSPSSSGGATFNNTYNVYNQVDLTLANRELAFQLSNAAV